MEPYVWLAAGAVLLGWTAAAAGVGWWVRGQVADASEALLRDDLADLAQQVAALKRQHEQAQQAAQVTMDHARRRLDAAGLDDPNARLRGVYDDDPAASEPPGGPAA